MPGHPFPSTSFGSTVEGIHCGRRPLQPSAKGSALPGWHYNLGTKNHMSPPVPHLCRVPLEHRGSPPWNPKDWQTCLGDNAEEPRRLLPSTNGLANTEDPCHPCGFSWNLEGKFLERDVLTELCNYFSGQRKLALQPAAWENIKGPLVDKTHSYNRTCSQNLLKQC